MGREVRTEVFEDYLATSRVALFLDGLGEVTPSAVEMFATAIARLVRRYPSLRVVATSRLLPSFSVLRKYFRQYQLRPFNKHLTRALVRALAPDSARQADSFLESVASNPDFSTLTSNPLLLSLLWSIFQSKGRLPPNTAYLYNDFSDYLLSSWNRHRGIAATALVPLLFKERFLEVVALHLVENGFTRLPRTEIIALAEELVQRELRPGGGTDIPSSVVDEIVGVGLLVDAADGAVMFPHKSFVEYYAGRAIANDAARLRAFVTQRQLHEVVVFAAGLAGNSAEVVGIALTEGEVLLAARCVSSGRSRDVDAANAVISRLLEDVGRPFRRLLESYLGVQEIDGRKVEGYDSLLRLWQGASTSGANSHEKGKRFERFSKEFFGQFFKVIYSNLNTENGELDLILEVTKMDPFWGDFGGEVLVECKNWDSRRPLKEVAAFAHKVMSTRDTKLAFFLSISGFTADALRTLKNQASDPTRPLIVPVTGEEIETALTRKSDLEEFFKAAIREMKYLRKY